MKHEYVSVCTLSHILYSAWAENQFIKTFNSAPDCWSFRSSVSIMESMFLALIARRGIMLSQSSIHVPVLISVVVGCLFFVAHYESTGSRHLFV